MNVNVAQGSIARLKRIQELKGYDEQKALDFAISLAWMITEKRKAEFNEGVISTVTPKEESNMFDVSELRDSVVKILMTDHDFLVDDAEEAVKDSYTSDPDIWNENADAKDLANLLASDDVDEVI